MSMLFSSSQLAGAPDAPSSALRQLPRVALPMILAASLTACGQKGPLFIPDTPPAAQRATLPQSVFGGSRSSKGKADEHGAANTESREQQRQDAQDAWPDPDFDEQP